MKIAFYAPLKSPNHPVPSGDRLMARLLMQAMTMGGHEVSVASELRSFLKQPDEPARTSLAETAEREIETITQRWQLEGAPDLWFCYHPYYKALDLLGPELARRFDIPYVTAEASYSPKRNGMGWQVVQDRLLAALNVASINICLTARDREGLVRASPALRWAMLPPFIDAEAFLKNTPNPTPAKLIAVAMMRAGDKLDSYRALAEALALLPQDINWTLDIVGDGPERAAVQAMFSAFPDQRLVWHGEKTASEIAMLLSKASLYVWPGHGEAYGLAYLEAQAAGLPVVAEKVAGVPEVVKSGTTGLLTPENDTAAYADAIKTLIGDDNRREELARAARQFVRNERSLENAAKELNHILLQAKARRS
ncbi:glycosyltransferase involved in cell wall biosynthesis [Agrobacterium tumefaciens]|uniref:glycosyltransferase family 4 protein n=1 Tax=Agrobacterium tumefaciens TaxID=358 RepID=UPI000DCF95C4|nr:glycosyltransferase family 4 protein [Agrobacterium tumefaciens]MBP2509459.1 glycosyltransferase involved in cell wall biosynthesis [Agrobacterium tumefaciens]MBP2518342.1 glycosyltransferase involved in cell wall biosynthesis [Agrobacterium tumefaciens]MBP2577653.1 glycosyltransferase involved in cell wall biosynthesis [Agrobacterium tumefaciens]MBP2595599.1 glycosyltransferase involved in cell wall biosynthesis [Agrobacterium tumefaciens]UXS25040.1 glycosyltransferase family 4 protein [Ag